MAPGRTPLPTCPPPWPHQTPPRWQVRPGRSSRKVPSALHTYAQPLLRVCVCGGGGGGKWDQGEGGGGVWEGEEDTSFLVIANSSAARLVLIIPPPFPPGVTSTGVAPFIPAWLLITWMSSLLRVGHQTHTQTNHRVAKRLITLPNHLSTEHLQAQASCWAAPASSPAPCWMTCRNAAWQLLGKLPRRPSQPGRLPPNRRPPPLQPPPLSSPVGLVRPRCPPYSRFFARLRLLYCGRLPNPHCRHLFRSARWTFRSVSGF